MNLPRPLSDVRGWTTRTRSSWALPAFLVLLGVSVVLLAGAAFAADYVRDLLLNLGAGFVILAFGSVVFEPVVEQARRGRVSDGPRLDHRNFCERIAQAGRSVVIHGTWTGLLETEHRERFFDRVTRALENDVAVRLLLIDPDSAAARQRAEELKNIPDVDGLIRENLRLLDAFVRVRSGRGLSAPEVRIHAASVSETLYQVDERAIVGKLPLDRLGYNSPQSEANVHHPLMTGLVNRVEELWSYTRTIRLADYMEVKAVVHVDAAGTWGPPYERTIWLRYVIDSSDRTWYVIARGPDERLPRPETGTMTATLTRPGEGEGPTTSTLVAFRDDTRDVEGWFTAKYGPDLRVEDIHRLVRPDEEAA